MPWLDASWAAPGWHDEGAVPFDPADRGLLLGDGVFDTALVLGGVMVWRAAHVARLLDGCRALGFVPDRERIEAAIDAVLARTESGSLRVTVTRGPGPRGLAPPIEAKPTIVAGASPLRRAALFAPLRLHESSILRNDTAPAARLKSLGYGDAIAATRDAIAASCDDALFLNTRGLVACTGVGNLFILVGEQLVTPPLTDGVVAGTTRGMLLSTCESIGLEAVERSFGLAEVERADAVVVTNSLRLVAPVVGLGRRDLSDSPRVAALAGHLATRIAVETGIDPLRLARG